MSSSPILENLLYDKKGAIAYVTLNRPRVLNALNQQTWKELRTVFEDARDDPEIRGGILTGAGDKAFIAGADIGELAHVTAVEAEQSSSYGQPLSTDTRWAAAARPRWPAPSEWPPSMPNSDSPKSASA